MAPFEVANVYEHRCLPCSVQFMGNLVVGSRELELIEVKVGGSGCYQGKDASLVGAELAPTGRYLLFKTGGTYRTVGVFPQVLKDTRFKGRERNIRVKRGNSRQIVLARTKMGQYSHLSPNWCGQLFITHF